jgi:hypothetical protein
MADYASILSLTPEMTDEKREEMIELAFVRARDIVAVNADQVRRLAKLLIAARCVNLSDVRPPVVARSSTGLAPKNARRA